MGTEAIVSTREGFLFFITQHTSYQAAEKVQIKMEMEA